MQDENFDYEKWIQVDAKLYCIENLSAGLSIRETNNRKAFLQQKNLQVGQHDLSVNMLFIKSVFYVPPKWSSSNFFTEFSCVLEQLPEKERVGLYKIRVYGTTYDCFC